jgi:hypothetical protein
MDRMSWPLQDSDDSWPPRTDFPIPSAGISDVERLKLLISALEVAIERFETLKHDLLHRLVEYEAERAADT